MVLKFVKICEFYKIFNICFRIITRVETMKVLASLQHYLNTIAGQNFRTTFRGWHHVRCLSA